jgi:hypothetical protein
MKHPKKKMLIMLFVSQLTLLALKLFTYETKKNANIVTSQSMLLLSTNH